jgi:hypothetical protein
MWFSFPLDLKFTLYLTLEDRCAQGVRVVVKKKDVKDMKQNVEIFTDEMPLACTLSESELVTRAEEVSELFKGVQQADELTDGYALRFPGSDTWANRLLQFITFERGCCPFFTFALVFEPQQGPIWLHLRGSEGVKAIIEEMINRHIESNSQL